MKRSELRKIIREEVRKVARAMKKFKMLRLIEADSKIYVPKGQKAPKGKKLQTGPRGGQYFMGSAQEKENYGKSSPASKKTSKPNRKINAKELKQDLTDRDILTKDEESGETDFDVQEYAEYVNDNYEKLTGKKKPKIKYDKNGELDSIKHPEIIYKIMQKYGGDEEAFDETYGENFGQDPDLAYKNQSRRLASSSKKSKAERRKVDSGYYD